ncbi:hypothetical protein Barb4_03023 [Bacteroidales bacterium Barb4]|nr:hypothetical protein Barb4_03023 [Bacteroidales bacterium Barb4]
MKLLRTLLHALFVPVNAVLVILMVAAAFSDRVSPETSLAAAYLGLLFPFFLAANAAFLLYWLFMREWKPAAVCAAAFLLCFVPIQHYIPLHGKVNPLPKGQVIKVLTYNVMNFAGKPHTAKSPNRLIEYIIRSEADIVCLQEYTVAPSGNKGLTDAVVQKALNMYPYHSVIDLNTARWGLSGVAVFSKYPIYNSRKIDYNSGYNGSSAHELYINGKTLFLINNHLESFKLTQEDRTRYSGIIKSLDTETFGNLKNTFNRKLGPAFKVRAKQAEAVAREIQQAKADYTIVCGDFNDTPVSYTHRIIQGNLTDAFAASGRGFGVTYNQNVFRFRIDHILHSPNITPYNCTIEHVDYSDHYPVWCYLQLN